MLRHLSTRLAWLSIAVATAVALWASPAAAHALATGTAPASDEVVDSPPSEVVVEFNEPVTPVDAATGVAAPNGDRVDSDVSRGDSPSVLVIEIDADQRGTYLVGYRVVSDDGHPVAGTFTFSVGQRTEAPGADTLIGDTDGLVQALLYTGRFLGYAGLALALGAGVLLAAGARPRAYTARLIAAGLSAVAATAVLGIPLQAAYESGVPLTALDAPALQTVMESPVGLAALLRLLLVLLALPPLRGLITAAEPGRGHLAGLTAVGLAMVATWPLAGHPMATDPVPVAFAADGLHLAAALTWAGGIAALLAIAIKRGACTPAATRRFWVALVPWLLGTVVVAGTATALLHIDSIAALTDTRYGRLVALKALLLTAIVAVGLLTRKALLRDGGDGTKALRRLVGVELALAAAVLAAVVVLVQAVPAKTALLEGAGTAEQAETAALVTTDLYSGQLILEPGRPGPNSVRILVSDSDGEPLEIAEWEAEWGLEGEPAEPLRLIELRGGILGGEISVPEAGRYVFTFTLTDAEGRAATAETALEVALPVAEGPPGVLGQLEAPLLQVPVEVLGQESGGVGGQGRVVAVAADRHRRHERGVGLDQHRLGRGGRGGPAQHRGVLERDVAGEAHEVAAPGALGRERGVPGEAVHHHPLRRPFLVQDRQDVVVGVAVVDDQGLAAALGDLDVAAEGLGLRRAAGLAGAVVVQPGFADRGDPRQCRQLVDRRQRRVQVRRQRRLVGVQRHRRQHPVVGRGQVARPAGRFEVGADLHHGADAGRLGPVDQFADGRLAGFGGARPVLGVAAGDDVEVGVAVADGGRERFGQRGRFGSVHASTIRIRLP